MASSKQERETDQVIAAARRMIRASARRVASGELEHLADLVQLADDVDSAIALAVAGLKAPPHWYSNADIGKALDITRQAVSQRWPNATKRSAGGQPAHLR